MLLPARGGEVVVRRRIDAPLQAAMASAAAS
jgi:hypothetical protein